ncbi:uncharacterized protein ACRADG_007446 isoform 1-T2 [Cochliomyia hominivorax]
MEFALPELLTRDDILRILQQRQLHVENMNELTHEELLRVYKTFVLPLSQRPERSKRVKSMAVEKSPVACEENHMQAEPLCDITSSAMDIDFPNGEYFNESNRMRSPVGEKRRQRCSDDDHEDMMENDYQYQLSSVTKRIRINSLS